MKTASRWYSERLEQEIGLVRWGHWGQPVLIFPTAGGDAEEIERMHLIGALGAADRRRPDQGLFLRQPRRPRLRLQDRLGRVPLRAAQPLRGVRRARGGAGDPRRLPRDGVEVVAAGASLGAFIAVAVACRYPWLFRAAVGMSGSYDLERVCSASAAPTTTTSRRR